MKEKMFFPGAKPWRASPTVVSVEEAIAALKRAGYTVSVPEEDLEADVQDRARYEAAQLRNARREG